jgi:hypothetical protein
MQGINPPKYGNFHKGIFLCKHDGRILTWGVAVLVLKKCNFQSAGLCAYTDTIM